MTNVAPPKLSVRVASGERDLYHNYDAASFSGLWAMRRSPAHYLARKSMEPTGAMVLGSAIHDKLLDPEWFGQRYALWGKRGPRNRSPLKQEWDAFKEANAGKDILDCEDTGALNGMSSAIEAHRTAGKILRETGLREQSIYWQFPDRFVECKAKPDGIHPKGILWDLKAMEDARPFAVQRAIAEHGYHLQAAWYRQGVNLAIEAGLIESAPITACCLVVVEKAPPHGVVVYQFDEQALAAGLAEAMVQLSNLEECIRAEKYPAYSEEIEVISLPKWASQ